MKRAFFRLFAPIAAGVAAMFAAPLFAEVTGVATSQTEAVLVQSEALNQAYRLIPENFPQAIQQRDEIRKKLSDLNAALQRQEKGEAPNADTRRIIEEAQRYNANNNTLERVAAAWVPAWQEGFERASKPITDAQIYVIEQLLQKLEQIHGVVAAAQNASVIMVQGGHIYESGDLQLPSLDAALLTELNRQLPAVRIVPPEGYEPSQQARLMHQRVQSLLQALAQRQSQAGQ